MFDTAPWKCTSYKSKGVQVDYARTRLQRYLLFDRESFPKTFEPLLTRELYCSYIVLYLISRSRRKRFISKRLRTKFSGTLNVDIYMSKQLKGETFCTSLDMLGFLQKVFVAIEENIGHQKWSIRWILIASPRIWCKLSLAKYALGAQENEWLLVTKIWANQKFNCSVINCNWSFFNSFQKE